MTTDRNGCSTCQKGEEKWESFSMIIRGGRKQRMIQYEYRAPSGNLFTIVRPTLQECREAKDRHVANGLK